MALKVYLDDGCKAERSCVVCLSGRKRQGWSRSKSLGNSPLLDFIELLQTGWWWAWRCSTHLVTLELEDGVCPTASTDYQKRGDRRSHQKQCAILLCTRKKNQHKRWESWTCCDTDVLQTWFLCFPSIPKFWQIKPVVSNVLIFVEPIPVEYGPVKTSPRRFHVESGLCCTAVKVRQEEEICCKSATSWQLSGCKSF